MLTTRAITRVFTMCAAVLILSACGKQPEADTEFPITTASEEARESFMQARSAADYGREDDARDLFDKAIAADPAFAMAYFERAKLSNSAAEWKQFTDLAQEHKATASEAEQLLIDMIPLYMKADREGQLAQAKKLTEMYPKSLYAHMVLIQAYNGMKMTDDARKTAEAAIALDASFAPAYRSLAMSHVFNEPIDYGQAENYANTYVELQPQEADAHIVLGDVYRAKVELEKAREAYGKAIEVDADHPVAHAKRGHANTFLGNYDEARADFERAMDVSTGTGKMSGANFGVNTYVYAGDLQAALDANQAVIDNIPQLIQDVDAQQQARGFALWSRSRIATEAGQFDEAMNVLIPFAEIRRATASKFNEPAVLADAEIDIAVAEGWLAAKKGDFEKANALADKIVDLAKDERNPRKNEGAHALKGLVALQQGDAAGALEHFAKADGEWVVVKFYKAQAEEAAGNTDAAMALYREVADWNFNSLDYALIRGKAMAKLQ